jgi:SagB-type dehydrogenase family enzyme
MSLIKPPSPKLREPDEDYRPYRYGTKSKTYLTFPTAPPDKNLFSLLATRVTERQFGSVTKECVGDLLYHCTRVLGSTPPDSKWRWQHRPIPSAGGIHPVDLVLLDFYHPAALLYDPVAHAFSELKIQDQKCLDALKSEIGDFVNIGSGTVLWMIADFERVLQRYDSGETLVWKDVGALIGTLALVGEAMGLNFCPLGLTGEPWIGRIFDFPEKVVGAGGIVLGKRKS